MELRPGITDWASIWNSDEGGVLDGAIDADAVYEEVIAPIKRKLQLRYYNEHSFFGDLKIIFCTIFCIVKKQWRPKELDGYPPFDEHLHMTPIYNGIVSFYYSSSVSVVKYTFLHHFLKKLYKLVHPQFFRVVHLEVL